MLLAACGLMPAFNFTPLPLIVTETLRLQLDEKRQWQWQIPMDRQANEAILIVSGNTLVTRPAAVYVFTVRK